MLTNVIATAHRANKLVDQIYVLLQGPLLIEYK